MSRAISSAAMAHNGHGRNDRDDHQRFNAAERNDGIENLQRVERRRQHQTLTNALKAKAMSHAFRMSFNIRLEVRICLVRPRNGCRCTLRCRGGVLARVDAGPPHRAPTRRPTIVTVDKGLVYEP